MGDSHHIRSPGRTTHQFGPGSSGTVFCKGSAQGLDSVRFPVKL